MANICMIIAVLIFMVGIACGTFLTPSWKSVGITGGLLVAGIVFFGLALTL